MFEEKINDLKKMLVEYALFVDDMINKSVKGLLKNDKGMLLGVIQKDEPIANSRELVIEENCFVLIAQFSPKAIDMRTILMVLKINNDLERIGDMAVNVCQSNLFLAGRRDVEHLDDLEKMSSLAEYMLKDSINSFINNDPKTAKDVCERDDAVDEIGDHILQESIKSMGENPAGITASLHVLRISRDLERLADLATNIAEDVIFMVEGRVIKHHKDEILDDSGHKGENNLK